MADIDELSGGLLSMEGSAAGRSAPRPVPGPRPSRIGRDGRPRLRHRRRPGVVNGLPVTAEFLGHLVDAVGTPADLPRSIQRPARSVMTSRGSGDAVVLLGPAAIRAISVRTPPPSLVPDQSCAAAEQGRSTSLLRSAGPSGGPERRTRSIPAALFDIPHGSQAPVDCRPLRAH